MPSGVGEVELVAASLVVVALSASSMHHCVSSLELDIVLGELLLAIHSSV